MIWYAIFGTWDGVSVFGISDGGLDILDGVFENWNLTIFILCICATQLICFKITP